MEQFFYPKERSPIIVITPCREEKAILPLVATPTMHGVTSHAPIPTVGRIRLLQAIRSPIEDITTILILSSITSIQGIMIHTLVGLLMRMMLHSSVLMELH